MKIYVVERENGSYEDRTREIMWVGTDEEEAFKRVHLLRSEWNIIGVWEYGTLISQYMRGCYRDPDKEEPQYEKWERNCGEVIDRLEVK